MKVQFALKRLLLRGVLRLHVLCVESNIQSSQCESIVDAVLALLG